VSVIEPTDAVKRRMANRQGDVDLREAQVSVPKLALWLGLAVLLNAHVRK
jgi:hypothetical protein